jgi:hypothetical protein
MRSRVVKMLIAVVVASLCVWHPGYMQYSIRICDQLRKFRQSVIECDNVNIRSLNRMIALIELDPTPFIPLRGAARSRMVERAYELSETSPH